MWQRQCIAQAVGSTLFSEGGFFKWGLPARWRHGFSAVGLGLGFLVFVGGSLYLSAYLLALSLQHRGDMGAALGRQR